MSEFSRPKTPWWYWLVVVLFLLWNAGGGYDYIMTVTENEAYLSQIPEETMDYYMALPGWLVWPWAIAVWGAILGWLLMLLRSRFAVPVFIVSLIAMLINFGYWIPTGGFAVMPTIAMIMTVFIIAGALFAIWFSRRMRARGILR